MKDKNQIESMDYSRRAIMRGGARAAGALMLLAIGGLRDSSTAASKVSKKVVAYQDTPKGKLRCDNCALFQAPNACQSVDGEISPQGWCRIWRAK